MAIKHGFKSGSILATGIVLSDFFVCVLIILLVNFGATNLIKDEKTQRFMGILAGLVLVVFGAFHFKAPPAKRAEEELNVYVPSTLAMLFKGFFLNLLNPAVWLIWLGNVTAVSKTLKYSVISMIIYFGITLGVVLLVEMSKILAASKLKKILTDKAMHRINIFTGALMLAFGLILVYNYYFEQT